MLPIVSLPVRPEMVATREDGTRYRCPLLGGHRDPNGNAYICGSCVRYVLEPHGIHGIQNKSNRPDDDEIYRRLHRRSKSCPLCGARLTIEVKPKDLLPLSISRGRSDSASIDGKTIARQAELMDISNKKAYDKQFARKQAMREENREGAPPRLDPQE